MCIYIPFQNEGEINFFDVRVKNNGDDSHKTIWSLQNPHTTESLEEGWIIGRVQFLDMGEPEYQVKKLIHLCSLSDGL